MSGGVSQRQMVKRPSQQVPPEMDFERRLCVVFGVPAASTLDGGQCVRQNNPTAVINQNTVKPQQDCNGLGICGNHLLD